MAWSPAQEAGFVLAAWLADDRDLRRVEAALVPAQLAALRALSASPGLHADGPLASQGVPSKVETVQRLMRVLRPALDERALELPARARTLLARLAPSALRKRLLEGGAPVRAHYQADEELIALLLRAARNAAPGPAP